MDQYPTDYFAIWHGQVTTHVSNNDAISCSKPVRVFVELLINPAIKTKSVFADSTAYTQISIAFYKSWKRYQFRVRSNPRIHQDHHTRCNYALRRLPLHTFRPFASGPAEPPSWLLPSLSGPEAIGFLIWSVG